MNKRFVSTLFLVIFAVLIGSLWVSGASVFGQVRTSEVAPSFKALAIVTGEQSTIPEVKAAEILQARILKRSGVTVEIVREDVPNLQKVLKKAELVLVVGSRGHHRYLSELMAWLDMRLPVLPNSDQIHPEGFAVKSRYVSPRAVQPGFEDVPAKLRVFDGKNVIVVAGADERGTIYGVGWLLRAITFWPDALWFPGYIGNHSEKPAFPLRGGRPTGPGSRARQYGNLRPQTAEELQEVMEDLMLLGTNIFEGEPDYVHSYGMMTVFGRTANEMPAGFPKEWSADGGRSPKYVCPSIPEARQALLDSFDKMFREMPDYDFFTTNSGDEGGCRCDRCMPWGDKYIRLVHDIADILHKYHPNTKVLATNQDLTNEGNQAIFDYLNSTDSSWLYAIRYGPGADEMQEYIRGPVNPRWFEYEGFGPLGNYLKFMHHELPRATTIALYTDVTHWMQAQFAVPHPDVALAAVYDRRSWNARPNNFHAVAQEILHYAVGDMHYSEGMHDDFNKWFWYRSLWDPNQDAEYVTKEYCRYWFGPQAQEEISQAIFLMEETLDRPVIDNPGIAKAVELLRSAGRRIPENLLKHDYRWRVILQKALTDRYLQLELQRGRELKDAAAQILRRIAKSKNPAADLTEALELLAQPLETAQMKAVMDEAKAVGEESNNIIGYREPACFLIEKLDLTEVGWWKKALQDALATESERKMRNAAKMVLHYAEPGPGGYYDDLGWPEKSEHLVFGDTLWGFMPFPGPAKLSHYNLAYTFGTPGRGVSFVYDGLSPKAQYVVRVSVGGHLDEEMSMLQGIKLAEGLEADGQVISDGFPIPMGDIALYEFDLPRAITKDGHVQISMVPKSDRLAITGLQEIWLMRKEKMPWTARP
ncbi:MAG: hypothetical protein HY706_11770 [Candidatus Hydrogenedentes bacterium]|nr:hypothetical protein [Candidatus Hydrogenedentota bacterium]